MMRKIKNILQNKENNCSSSLSSSSSACSTSHHHQQLNNCSLQYATSVCGIAGNTSVGGGGGSNDLNNQTVTTTSGSISARNETNKFSKNSSPVSFIKRKIKSTKSWVKIPRQSKLFHQQTSFESSSVSPESVSDEFETYTRNNLVLNRTNFVEYGFKKNPTPSSLVSPDLNNKNDNDKQKHSTLNLDNTNRHNISHNNGNGNSGNNGIGNKNFQFVRNYSNSCLDDTKNSKLNQENFLYFKIIQKLTKSSISKPANVPILCVQSFNVKCVKWHQLSNQLNFMRKNLKLIDLDKGVPVNALFYLSDLDLIYVKTADDLEGCVPRDCCKPIACVVDAVETPTQMIINPTTHQNEQQQLVNDMKMNPSMSSNVNLTIGQDLSLFSNINNRTNNENTTNNYLQSIINNNNNTNTGTSNINTSLNNETVDKSEDISIKYHSLSTEMEYDDLIEENHYSNIGMMEPYPVVDSHISKECALGQIRQNDLTQFGVNQIQFNTTNDSYAYDLNNRDMNKPLIRSQMSYDMNTNSSQASSQSSGQMRTFFENDLSKYELKTFTSTDFSAIDAGKNTRDSGYKSDVENLNKNYKFVNDYAETAAATAAGDCVIGDGGGDNGCVIDIRNNQQPPEVQPESIDKCLLNLKSRSRLPISIRSNLNLTIMDDEFTSKLNENRFVKDNTKSTSFKPVDWSASSDGYCNLTYKSPFGKRFQRTLTPKLDRKNEFERTPVRRSLDSSLQTNSIDQRVYAVSIDIDDRSEQYFYRPNSIKSKLNEINNRTKSPIPAQPLQPPPPPSLPPTQSLPFPDLDIKKIELDSINEDKETVDQHHNNKITNENDLARTTNVNLLKAANRKVWTIILKHSAKSYQEINVTPGMLVLVIKEYNDWLYVKLIGDNSNSLQRYGFIPRTCAVDLQEIIHKSKLDLTNLEPINQRRSQITAL